MTWKGLQAGFTVPPQTPTPFFHHTTPAVPQIPRVDLSMSSLEPFHAIDVIAVILGGIFFTTRLVSKRFKDLYSS